MKLRYFSNNDFLRATPKCSIEQMNPVFLEQLHVARFHSKVPYIVNSAYRTKEHELKKGRDGTSSHCKGMAVDLKADNARVKFKVVTGLLKVGLTRIFFYDWGIHVDCDPEKDQEVMRYYHG